jgi:thioredoxin-related protein
MPQPPFTRRTFLAGCALAAIVPALSRRAQGAELSEDGLFQEPWFLQSFLDLREDFREARSAGKSFALLWELKGCPYCKLLHTENFANPKIAAYAQENFVFLQLNLIGSRPVTDFDGTELPEKAMAQKQEVQGTPTIQFFMDGKSEIAREAGRTQYLKPAEFLGMLRFVREKAYETTPFDDWLRANPQAI